MPQKARSAVSGQREAIQDKEDARRASRVALDTDNSISASLTSHVFPISVSPAPPLRHHGYDNHTTI